MDFINPYNNGFTIYSKSGCNYCLKIKTLLKETNLLFTIVDCDKYIIEDKKTFLFFINQKANKEVKLFPMIFYDGKFIGDYSETKIFIDKLLAFN